MAQAGLGSRRKIDGAIVAGEVHLNGKRAESGESVQAGDTVGFDDTAYRVVTESARAGRVLIYNKPEGEVTTRKDPQGRATVFAHLPRLENERWISIGRLDINSSGLLLFTTDGDLAQRMMHPSAQVDKEYLCRIHGHVPAGTIKKLKDGVKLDDGMARFTDIVAGEARAANRWYTVTVMEGRNRLVRRLWESQGVQVNRLKRVRHGAVFLPRDLRPGRSVELQPSDVKTLREDVGLDAGRNVLTLTAARPKRVAKPKRRTKSRHQRSKRGK